MPKEYKECVKTEKKKHSEKDAKRICAISYWKRHGVSVKEADKKAKKSVNKPGDKNMRDLIVVARSKEALKTHAYTVAKSLNSQADDLFVLVPITKAMRKDKRLLELVPEIADEVYKYALIRKSLGDKEFVRVGLEGGLQLDWSAVDNQTAEKFNVPERHDVGDEHVDVKQGEEGDVAKSVEADAEKCKGNDCMEDDKKVEKSVKEDESTDAERRTEVGDVAIDVDAGDDSSKPPVSVTAKSAESIAEKIVEHLAQKGVNASVEEIANIIKAEVTPGDEAPVVESNAVKSESSSEEKSETDKDVLGRVMSKVAKGEELSGLEEKIHNAAVAAAKGASGKGSSSEAGKLLSKIMSKVAQGEELSEEERKVLAAAVDATKKARSEVQKSLQSLMKHIETMDETPIGIYKSITNRDPEDFGGMLVFVNKHEANSYLNAMVQKSIISGGVVIRRITTKERAANLIPQTYLFTVDLPE